MEEMSVTSPNSVNLGGHPHQLNEAVAFDSFNQSAYIEPPKPSRTPEPQESIINEDIVTNVTEDSPLPANSGANNDTNQNPMNRTIKEEEIDENEAPKIDYEEKSVSFVFSNVLNSPKVVKMKTFFNIVELDF